MPATFSARIIRWLVVALMSNFSGRPPEEATAWLDRHLGPSRLAFSAVVS